jgi:hypothetical protein
VDDPLDPAFIEMVDEAMRAYKYALLRSEPTLTNPSEDLKALKRLMVGKAPGTNGIPSRLLRHLPKHAITFLTKVFNAVLHRHYFPATWEHPCMISILQLGKYLTLPSSYKPVSLLDTVGKLFERSCSLGFSEK